MMSSMRNALEGEGSSGIQDLPVEVLVLIFKKVICGEDLTIGDVKCFAQCSTLCKQFSSAIPLIPSLSITYNSVDQLYVICPKILKKFKQINSLSLQREYCDTKYFHWSATFEPRKYCINGAEECDNAEDLCKLFKTNSKAEPYVYSMMELHHRLVVSFPEHERLQRLVVGDYRNRGRLILDKEQLAEFRNIGTVFRPYGVGKYIWELWF